MKAKLFCAILSFAMAGCAGSGTAKGYLVNTELLQQIDNGTPPVIADVRSAWEYRRGHVPGAVSIPFWAAYFNADKVTSSQTETLVVYCEHGPRAGIAKLGLRIAGVKNIVYLKGHMAAWKKAGLRMEK